MKITETGTIILDENKILHFGIDDFIQKICIEDNCFLCGAEKNEKEFNDEHIIPKWILRKHKLFNKNITLPNKITYRYSKYTIPCCKECNVLLGNKLENIICDAFSKDYQYFVKCLEKNYPCISLFLYLACTDFLKNTLKG